MAGSAADAEQLRSSTPWLLLTLRLSDHNCAMADQNALRRWDHLDAISNAMAIGPANICAVIDRISR
jgi:hypothetical protein